MKRWLLEHYITRWLVKRFKPYYWFSFVDYEGRWGWRIVQDHPLTIVDLDTYVLMSYERVSRKMAVELLAKLDGKNKEIVKAVKEMINKDELN